MFGLSIGPSDSRQGHIFAFYNVGRNVVGNEYIKVDLCMAWRFNDCNSELSYPQ